MPKRFVKNISFLSIEILTIFFKINVTRSPRLLRWERFFSHLQKRNCVEKYFFKIIFNSIFFTDRDLPIYREIFRIFAKVFIQSVFSGVIMNYFCELYAQFRVDFPEASFCVSENAKSIRQTN